MKNLVLISTAVSLALAGCSKNDRNDQAATSTEAVVDETAVTPTTEAISPGQAFANAAAASDTFEIETSKLAATHAASAKVKAFAEQMIKAHTESTAKLKSAAGSAVPAITPDPAMTPAQQQVLQSLTSAQGTSFDQAYAKAQADAHQATLDALKTYSANGDVASLKSFATELVPIVTAHLNMAKGL